MILLVEDDDDVREMLAMTLDEYPVEIARNGTEALAALTKLSPPPCLVVLDLKMPVMTGWQVIEWMKASAIDVPVCVISALSDRAPREAIATLHKPFEPSELLALAARYCRHARDAHHEPRVRG